MKKSYSCDSFFRYIPKKPLISSFPKFLKYAKEYNINLNNKSKKIAFFILLNSLKRHFTPQEKKKFLEF